jgi:hypothetical protein
LALSRNSASDTIQENELYEFQPRGGVSANPLEGRTSPSAL